MIIATNKFRKKKGSNKPFGFQRQNVGLIRILHVHQHVGRILACWVVQRSKPIYGLSNINKYHQIKSNYIRNIHINIMRNLFDTNLLHMLDSLTRLRTISESILLNKSCRSKLKSLALQGAADFSQKCARIVRIHLAKYIGCVLITNGRGHGESWGNDDEKWLLTTRGLAFE